MIDGRASKQQATSFRKYYQLSKKAEPLTGLCLFRGIGCTGRVHPEPIHAKQEPASPKHRAWSTFLQSMGCVTPATKNNNIIGQLAARAINGDPGGAGCVSQIRNCGFPGQLVEHLKHTVI
jgi:hypothetical protein